MKHLINEFRAMDWQDRVALKGAAFACVAVMWILIVEVM
jgi:hypothetical protein